MCNLSDQYFGFWPKFKFKLMQEKYINVAFHQFVLLIFKFSRTTKLFKKKLLHYFDVWKCFFFGEEGLLRVIKFHWLHDDLKIINFSFKLKTIQCRKKYGYWKVWLFLFYVLEKEILKIWIFKYLFSYTETINPWSIFYQSSAKLNKRRPY